MPASPFPTNDNARLSALRETGILFTKPETIFDEITAEAAQEAAAPIALISFVDKDVQWFKSKVGIDVDSTPRHASFCSWAVYNAEVLWVEDATRDERFSDNPLVHGDPNIRHYAGAPIQTPDGYLLGTICVIDRVPRPYDASVVEKLERLSQKVSAALFNGRDRRADSIDRAG